MFWGKERNFSAGFFSGFHLKPQADFRFRGSPGKNELGWKKHRMGVPWQIHSWRVSVVCYTRSSTLCLRPGFALNRHFEEHCDITESSRLEKASKIFNLHVHPQYPGAAFSHQCFICWHILWGVPRGLWIITPRDVFVQSMAGVGRVLGSTSTTCWLWAAPVSFPYIVCGLGAEIPRDMGNPQMSPQFLVR